MKVTAYEKIEGKMDKTWNTIALIRNTLGKTVNHLALNVLRLFEEDSQEGWQNPDLMSENLDILKSYVAWRTILYSLSSLNAVRNIVGTASKLNESEEQHVTLLRIAAT